MDRVITEWHPQSWRRTRRAMTWLSAAGWVWLCSAAVVFGQTNEFGEETEEKTYVPSYMIIIFAVGFALLVICRSGKRSTSFRREE